jgi:hypothetical protein
MQTNASFKIITDYLLNLGAQHIDIGDAFRFNQLELAGSLKNSTKLSVMLVDSIETKADDTNNKTFHNNYCAFTVLGKPGVSTAKIDSYDAQNEVLQHCQQICFEIAARIKHDATETDLDGSLKWMYGTLERGSFHYFKVGPVFAEQLYGYRCEFTLKPYENYKVDTTKWNDL